MFRAIRFDRIGPFRPKVGCVKGPADVVSALSGVSPLPVGGSPLPMRDFSHGSPPCGSSGSSMSDSRGVSRMAEISDRFVSVWPQVAFIAPGCPDARF